MRPRVLLASLLLLPVLPLVPPAAAYHGCDLVREETVVPGLNVVFPRNHLYVPKAGDFNYGSYLFGFYDAGWWEEANGKPGLQRYACYDGGWGPSHEADRKVTLPTPSLPRVVPGPVDYSDCYPHAPRDEYAGIVISAAFPGYYFYAPRDASQTEMAMIGWWRETNGYNGLQTRRCQDEYGLYYLDDTRSGDPVTGVHWPPRGVLGVPVWPLPVPDPATHDTDGDGAPDAQEAASSSDPASAASRPTTDDDNDGVQNQDESTRLHAMGHLQSPAVRASAVDRVTAHFGVPGATLTLTAPTGARMSVTYQPAGVGTCPGTPPREAGAIVHDCALPVVATFDLAGGFVSARGAFEPDVTVPAGAFRVVCTPAGATGPPASCLAGAGADGTWLLTPPQQAPRASTQARLPGGTLLAVQGKTYNDVAVDSGDVTATGSGQNSRDAFMGARAWNWQRQAPGTTHDACSGGLAAPCLTESPPQESPLYALLFLGP